RPPSKRGRLAWLWIKMQCSIAYCATHNSNSIANARLSHLDGTSAAPMCCSFPSRRKTMHKDEVKGSAKKVTGTVKDKVGKATGDKSMQAEGKAEKAEGSIQKGVGKAKDAVRDALKH